MGFERDSGKAGPSKRAKTSTSKQPEPDSNLLTPQSQANQVSSTAWSTRSLPLDHVPPLSTLCIRVFALKLKSLSSDHDLWEVMKSWLSTIPEPFVPRIFGALRETFPELLSHGFMVAYMFRGASITLTNDLPGVNKFTVKAIGEAKRWTELRELGLIGLEKMTDEVIASVVSKLPALQILNLRGCSKVGAKTATAIAKRCSSLVKLNLNYTGTLPASLGSVLLSCTKLAVLKVAGIPNWTDATAAKLFAELYPEDANDDIRFPSLINLNIRQTSLTDATINRVLLHCPNLQRLDLSFTAVHHPPLLFDISTLEKLSLTSTKTSGTDLIRILRHLPKLKSLSIGALGGGQGMSVAISNTSAMILTDQALREITDALEACYDLENLSLVGNTKLGVIGRHDRALAYFIRKVGRRCKKLNMAGIPSLRSSDLEGLLQTDADETLSPLQVLVLNNTGVDDGIAPFISACAVLETLELASTKVTAAGLFPIIDACTQLQSLNLTSCRGVSVVDRRRFFEVWEHNQNEG